MAYIPACGWKASGLLGSMEALDGEVGAGMVEGVEFLGFGGEDVVRLLGTVSLWDEGVLKES